MKILSLILLLNAGTAFAALNMKPGLWSISTKVKNADGKEYDPQAKMREAMAKMSPEQRKQMEAAMAKMSSRVGQNPSAKSPIGFDSKGMQICFTADLLKDEAAIARHKEQHECETSFPVKTATRVVTEFKCKSGTSGTAEWNVKDSTHYTGSVKMTSKDGKKTEMNHEGTFVSSDCGNVAPLSDSLKQQKSIKK